MEVEMNNNHHGDVEIIRHTHQGILAKKDSQAGLKKPLSMQQIDDFVSKNQGRKRRKYKTEYKDSIVVDLVVYNILEGVPIPSIGVLGQTLEWYKLEKKVLHPSKKNREELRFIKEAFEFVESWICDSMADFVFYPISGFQNKKVAWWAPWANVKLQSQVIMIPAPLRFDLDLNCQGSILDSKG